MTDKNAILKGALPRLDTLLNARAIISSATFVTAPVVPGAGDTVTDAPAATNDGTKPYEPESYHADPDETVICSNCEKANSPDAVFCDQCGFKLEGAVGVIVNDAATADETGDTTDKTDTNPAANAIGDIPTPTVPVNDPAKPAVTIQDDKGNIDPNAICANSVCGHLASIHEDGDSGDNSGKCD